MSRRRRLFLAGSLYALSLIFLIFLISSAPSSAAEFEPGQNLQVSAPAASGTTFKPGDNVIVSTTIKNSGFKAPFEARLEIRNPPGARTLVIYNSRPLYRFRLERDGSVALKFELIAPAVAGTYSYRLRVRNIYSATWQVRQPEGDAWGNLFEVVSETGTAGPGALITPPLEKDTSAEAAANAAREAKEKAALEEAALDEKERVERATREWEERVTKEREEREARVRERETQEAREREERAAREREERAARDRAETEARDRAEQEAQEIAEREAREKLADEVRQKVEREAREREVRAARIRDAEERARKEFEENIKGRVVERGNIIIVLPASGAVVRNAPDSGETKTVSDTKAVSGDTGLASPPIKPEKPEKIDTGPQPAPDRPDTGLPVRGEGAISFSVEPARLIFSTNNGIKAKFTDRSITLKGNFADGDPIRMIIGAASDAQASGIWLFKVGEEFSLSSTSDEFPFSMSISGNVMKTADGAKLLFREWTITFIDLQSLDKYEVDATIQGLRPDQKAPFKIIVTPGEEMDVE